MEYQHNRSSKIAVLFYEASDGNCRVVENLRKVPGVKEARYANSSSSDPKDVCLVTAENPDLVPSVKAYIDQMFLPAVEFVIPL